MEAMRKRQAAFAKHIGLGSLEDDTDEDSVAAADTKGGATSSKVFTKRFILYTMHYLVHLY